MFAAGITDQFFHDILSGVHQPGDVYKIALYTRATAPDKNAALANYNTTGELPTAGNYIRGGQVLKGFTVGLLPGRGASLGWASDPVWKNATFSADAAVIYNASRDNKALAVFGFGAQTSTNANFSVELHTDNSAFILMVGRVPA